MSVRAFRNLSRGLLLVGVAALLSAGSPSIAAARTAANPIIYVNFFANGSIAVTMADGTALGAPSGAPTVIPAGYYTLEFSGPGGCSLLPYFRLSGPGANIVTNGNEGQVVHPPSGVQFLPESPYSWSDDAVPGVVNQFTTNSQIVGAAPATASSSGSHGTTSSQDPVGSALPVFRGSLSGSIDVKGKVSVLRAGKPIKTLQAGRYKITIVDNGRSGFALERAKPHQVALSRGGFTGKRSYSVTLAAGTWTLTATPGARESFVVR
jgi:hypothetical protein